MSPAPESPLAGLVLCMVCLALFGSIIGGAHYYIIDLPEQKALSEHPPANPNSDMGEKCNTCLSLCTFVPEKEYYQCIADCELICD